MTIKNMRLSLALSMVGALALQSAHADWSVSGKDILDPNGNPFIYRGISLGDALAPAASVALKHQLAATKANVLKVPVTAGSLDKLANYINICKANDMVCVLSNVDAYGYGDNSNGKHILSSVISMWQREDVKALLTENKDHVVVNIANAPYGDFVTEEQFVDSTKAAITYVRGIGITNQLIIDASHWGQDTERFLSDNAQDLLEHDALGNLVFSISMYDQFPTEASVRSYLQGYLSRNLPIVIGEFAPTPRKRYFQGTHPYATNSVAAETIMAVAEELGIGYVGWSLSSNTAEFSELNIVDSASMLTPWGELLINSENGIKSTARFATHFDGVVSDNIAPNAHIAFKSHFISCGDITGTLSAVNSSDLNGDALTYAWEITNQTTNEVTYSSAMSLSFPVDVNTHYRIKLTVDDGHGETDSKTISAGSHTSSCARFSASRSSTASWSSGFSQSSPNTSSAIASSSLTSSSQAAISSVASSRIDPSSAASSAVSNAPVISSSGPASVSSINASFVSSSAASQVMVNTPPTAYFNYRIELGSCSRMDASVSALGSSDPDGDTLTYSWRISNDVDATVITSTAESFFFPLIYRAYYTVELTVSDGRGGVSTATRQIAYQGSACSNFTRSSAASWSSTGSSSLPVSSSVAAVSSRISSSSVPSSIASSSVTTVAIAKATCSYVIQSEWQTGFVAVVRLKNDTTNPIDGWSLNLRYDNGATITNLWNANLQGSGPYSMSNLSWNKTIQPGQTVEFGFQGSKSANAKADAIISGASCQ